MPVEPLNREDTVEVITEPRQVEGGPAPGGDGDSPFVLDGRGGEPISPNSQPLPSSSTGADAQFGNGVVRGSDSVEYRRRPPGEDRARVQARICDRQGLEIERGARRDPEFVRDLDELALASATGHVGEFVAESSLRQHGMLRAGSSAVHVGDHARRYPAPCSGFVPGRRGLWKDVSSVEIRLRAAGGGRRGAECGRICRIWRVVEGRRNAGGSGESSRGMRREWTEGAARLAG